MQNIHVPDYLILPVGRAVKSDLQKIMLSAVSADSLYFSTDVPVISIRKSERKPLCLPEFPNHFQRFPKDCHENDEAILDIRTTLKSHNPNMTKFEEMFLDLCFGALTGFIRHAKGSPGDLDTTLEQVGLGWWLVDNYYKSPNDV